MGQQPLEHQDNRSAEGQAGKLASGPRRVIASLLVACLMLFGKAKRSARHCDQVDWTTSTQRLTVRFDQKIRDLWRRRWLKLRTWRR